MVECLLACVTRCSNCGASVNLTVCYLIRKTPLWLTAYNGSFWSSEYDTLMRNPKYGQMYDSMDDVLNFLVDAKADVNKTTKYGQIPLHWAAYHGNDSTVKKLVSCN